MNRIVIDITENNLNIKKLIKVLDFFIKKYNDIIFIIIGEKKIFNNFKKEKKIKNKQIKIFDITKIILTSKKIIKIPDKQNNSIIYKNKFLYNKKINALISNGSIINFLNLHNYVIDNISKKLNKLIFMTYIPTIKKNKYVLMLDVGANLENSAQDLVNFAIIATIYAQEIMNNPKPSVAILNIGKESSKGKNYHKETYKLLTNNKNIFFKGNVEPRDIINNIVDIVITDGFTGNIALKTLEGMIKNLIYVIKHELTKNFFQKLKTFFLQKNLWKNHEIFNYPNNSITLILGLKTIAIKINNINDKKSLINILELTRTIIINNFIEKVTIKLLKKD